MALAHANQTTPPAPTAPAESPVGVPRPAGAADLSEVEHAPCVEDETLRRDTMPVHLLQGIRGEGRRRRMEAPDVVAGLLGEPDVAVRVYRRRHDVIAALRRGPGVYPARAWIEPGPLIC